MSADDLQRAVRERNVSGSEHPRKVPLFLRGFVPVPQVVVVP